MMKLKKRLGSLLALGLTVSLLAGCGSSAEEAPEVSQSSSDSETADSGTEESGNKKYNVTLNVVGVDNVLSTTMMNHLDELEEEYGIKIEFQQFSNQQASNKIAESMD